MLNQNNNHEFFHVHTYRCGHAADVSDEAYVKEALSLGGKKITFTDHAPFPDDAFTNRMRYEELSEYLNSLSELKEQYKNRIDIQIGLEIEYLPSYEAYYIWLKKQKELDILMLGQHHFEIDSEQYSFNCSLSAQEKVQGLTSSTVKGIQSGYFNVVAHPDRIFKEIKEWNSTLSSLAIRIIDAAKKMNIPLEKNYSSMEQGNCYRNEFWMLAEERGQFSYLWI